MSINHEPAVVVFLTLLAAACTVSGLAATYHIAPDGDDTGPGSQARPWASLEHASQQAGPGDTVILQPGEYSGQLRPANSGQPGAPIVFRAAQRHEAVLTGVAEAPAAILRDIANIRLQGLAFVPDKPGTRWLECAGAESIQLDDLMMDGCDRSNALHIVGCAGVRLTGCTMLNGRSGNMVRVRDAQRLVFESCEFAGSPHALLLFLPDRTNQQVVIRGCVFAGRTGRTVLIDSVDRLLFEDNIIVRSLDGGRSAGPRLGFFATNSIFRGCRVFDNWGDELFRIQPYRQTLDFEHVRVYNNVFHDNCSDAIAIRNYEGKYNVSDSVFANNVFAENEPFGSDRQIIIRPEDPRGDIQFRSNLIEGNVEILGKLHQASDIGDGELFRDVVAAAPGFTDASAHEHVPAEESPLIDAGMFLTHTTTGGEGRRLQVEDARWFYDGFGVEGERGDVIAVGSPENLARVVRADPETGTVQVDRPLRYSPGDPVSLPWMGEAPDIGVFEVGAETLAPPVVVAHPPEAEPGEPVVLEAIMPTPVPDASFQWQLSDGTRLQGATVRHTFSDEGEWGLRVRVEGPGGEVVRAAGLVMVEDSCGPQEPLFHSTFGPADDEAWWRWQNYRPRPTKAERTETGEGYALHVTAVEDDVWIPCRTNPRGWNIDRDPLVTVRYRISEGTPVAAYLVAFPTHQAPGPRRIWLAGTEAAMPLPGDPQKPRTLSDDGQWHTLQLDARRIRQLWPEVTMLQRFAFEGQWMTARDRVSAGDEFWISEVTIGPMPDE